MDAIRLGQLNSAMQLLALSAVSFSGIIYRVTTPKYATRLDALSGEGSRYASGRFHVKGQFLIAYTGCTLAQAEWEFSKTARNAAISREDSLPITLLSANVQFSKVLDLTNPSVRRQLKVTKAELVQSHWNTSTDVTLTQAIGRLAHKHGFEAILAPSPRRAHNASNLNILPQNLLADSTVQIIHADRLPPH